MFAQVSFLLSPGLTAAAIYSIDTIPRNRPLNVAIFVLIAVSNLYSIWHPPWHSALANYLNGFWLAWYLVWSANILFVYDVRSLRRLRLTIVQDCHFCYWEPLRDTTRMRRLAWVVDLCVNFRGLGWMSTDVNASWPPCKYRWSPTTTYGRLQRLARLSTDCLIYAAARYLTAKMPASQLVNMLVTAPLLYSLMDGVHVTTSIIFTQLLGSQLIGTWGLSELYPPLFGKPEVLGIVDLKALWGQWWHDMLKAGLLSLSETVTSPIQASGAKKALLQSVSCFVLSASIHASASYSVSRNLPAAALVFVGFSSQIVGIAAQQSVNLLFMQDEQSKWRKMHERFRTVMKVLVGIGWIVLSLPYICGDDGLQAAMECFMGESSNQLRMVDAGL